MAEQKKTTQKVWDETAERFIAAVTARPYLTVALSLVVVIGLGYGAKYLTFSNDYKMFFSKTSPLVQNYEELQKTYSNDDAIVIGVGSEAGVFQRRTLKAIRGLTDDLGYLPHSRRVDSLTNYLHTEGRDDALVVEKLIPEEEKLSDSAIAMAKEKALADRTLMGSLVAKDLQLSAIRVTLELPDDDPPAVAAAVKKTRNILAEYREAYPDLRFALTGNVAVGFAFAEAGAADLQTLTPVMYGLVCVILLVTLRSVAGMLLSLGLIAMSVIATMGFMGWVGIKLTSTTAGVPTIVTTLAVADAVHFLVSFLAARAGAVDRKDAARQSLRANLSPIVLTSVTTAVGFLAMNFGDVPPFRDFGNVVAFGVMAAMALSLTLLPAVVTVLPAGQRFRFQGSGERFARFGEAVLRNRRRCLAATLVLVVVAVAAVPFLQVDDAFIKYFDKSMKIRSDSDFVTDHIGGLNTLEYSIEAPKRGGITDPRYLEVLDEFAAFARSQPEVTHVRTFSEVMKRLNKNLHGDREQWYRIPATRQLASQYLVLYEMSIPFGRDLTNIISIDKSASRLTVSLGDVSTQELLRVSRTLEGWLEENAPAAMQATPTGISYIFANLYYENIMGFMTGTLTSLVFITLCLCLFLRSFAFGVLSIVPNLTPLVLAYGAWYFIDGFVGLATATVASASLGIVVDDTVHFLSKYLRQRRKEGLDAEKALKETFRGVVPALVTTSAVLAGGFAVMTLSPFKPNAVFGLLICLTIGFALVADLFLLPPLMHRWEAKRNNAEEKRGRRLAA